MGVWALLSETRFGGEDGGWARGERLHGGFESDNPGSDRSLMNDFVQQAV